MLFLFILVFTLNNSHSGPLYAATVLRCYDATIHRAPGAYFQASHFLTLVQPPVCLPPAYLCLLRRPLWEKDRCKYLPAFQPLIILFIETPTMNY